MVNCIDKFRYLVLRKTDLNISLVSRQKLGTVICFISIKRTLVKTTGYFGQTIFCIKNSEMSFISNKFMYALFFIIWYIQINVCTSKVCF